MGGQLQLEKVLCHGRHNTPPPKKNQRTVSYANRHEKKNISYCKNVSATMHAKKGREVTHRDHDRSSLRGVCRASRAGGGGGHIK